MSIIWPADATTIDTTNACLHALVIGVGHYPHLMGGGGHQAVSNFGLQQLTTTIHTAKRIAEWLTTDYAHPSVRLGSVELLLSPGEPTVELSSLQNIRAAFRRWYARCHANPANVAFFYFAGHGISTASHYLLASDFGDPAELDLWENCIDFDRMRVGMRANNADAQLFFVDACREKPIDSLVHQNPHGHSLVSSTIFDQVAASGTYYAAADGLQAYGPHNGITYFATALLDAMNGGGAIFQNGQWVVDTFMLGSAIGQLMSDLALHHQQPLSCNPNTSGMPIAIHVPQTPKLRARVGCKSALANAEAKIVVEQNGMVLHVSPPGDSRPWRGHLEPGDYVFTASFTSLQGLSKHEKVGPPIFTWDIPA